MSVSGNGMNHVIYLLWLQIGKTPPRGVDAGKYNKSHFAFFKGQFTQTWLTSMLSFLSVDHKRMVFEAIFNIRFFKITFTEKKKEEQYSLYVNAYNDCILGEQFL